MRLYVIAKLFASAAMLLLLSSCTSQITLEVPSAERVATIEISEGYVGQKQEHTLREAEGISEVVGLVRSNNRGWSDPLDTYPTPKASATFKDTKGAVVFVLWFGPGWVGARSFSGQHTENVIWDASSNVQQQLKQLLGIGA
jgi:hypothetical protein